METFRFSLDGNSFFLLRYTPNAHGIMGDAMRWIFRNSGANELHLFTENLNEYSAWNADRKIGCAGGDAGNAVIRQMEINPISVELIWIAWAQLAIVSLCQPIHIYTRGRDTMRNLLIFFRRF